MSDYLSPDSMEMSSSSSPENWVQDGSSWNRDAHDNNFQTSPLQHQSLGERGQRQMLKKEQKRRPKPRDGTQLFCGVCNDKALGYNFDAITCESCKAFFRRNATKTKSFACSFEGQCKLDPHTRKFCSGCRLRKCFAIGMKKDWILSDDQLAKRRSRLRDRSSTISSSVSEQESQESPSSCGDISSSSFMDDFPTSTDYSISSFQPLSTAPTSPTSPLYQCVKEEPVDCEYENNSIPLQEEIKEGITLMHNTYSEIFEATYTAEQSRNLVENPNSRSELFNMTDIFIRRLIKFSKCIPEFKALKQEDQIHLLKGGIMEMFVLRSAMSFDFQNRSWKFKSQVPEGAVKEGSLHSQSLQQTLGNSMFGGHIEFVSSIHKLTGSDRMTLMLLFVMNLLSEDRPDLENRVLVRQAHEKFCFWLRSYLESRFPVRQARFIYSELLLKMNDVRKLGEASSKLAASLDIGRLEPLLVEVFDLK